MTYLKRVTFSCYISGENQRCLSASIRVNWSASRAGPQSPDISAVSRNIGHTSHELCFDPFMTRFFFHGHYWLYFWLGFFGFKFFFFGGRIWVDGDFNSFGMLQQRVSPTVPNSERNRGSLWLCISWWDMWPTWTWSWYVWVKALICMQMPKGFQNESTQNWVTWSLVLKIIVYCLQTLTASQVTALWWYLQLSMLWSFPESCDSSFISWAKWEKRFSGGFVGSIFAPIPHEMRGKWGHGGPKLFILVDSAQEYFSSCSYKSLLLGIRGQVNEVSRLIKLVHTQTEVFKDVHGLSLPYDF